MSVKNIIVDPKNKKIRLLLRIFGLIFLVAGGILLAIGAVDFFQAFLSFDKDPELFYLMFIGIFLLGIGGMMTALGFLKAMHSYVASEAAPVVADTFNYVTDNTSDSLANAASKIAGSINNNLNNEKKTIVCSSCGATNDKDAKFCKGCGKSLVKTCPKCGNEIKGDANFCDNCGAKLDNK